MGMTEGWLRQHGPNLTRLLGGPDFHPLITKLGVAPLSRAAGIDADSAHGALPSLLPTVLDLAKAHPGGAGALLGSPRTDGADALLGASEKLASGVFSKE